MVVKGIEAQTLYNFDGKFETYTNFMKEENPYLSLEDKNAIGEKMLKVVQTEFNEQEKQKKILEETKTKAREKTERATYMSVLSGKTTQDKLDELYENELLSKTAYDNYTDNLQNGGLRKSDSNQLLHIERNLLALSDDAILSSKLTNDDKIKMINKRETELKKQENEWVSNSGAKEGYSRIRNYFGIMGESLISSMTAEDKKGYAEVTSNFYDEVQKIPYEKRTAATIVNTAKKVLGAYKEKENEKQEAIKKQIKENEEKKLKQIEADKFKFGEFFDNGKTWVVEMFTDTGVSIER
jgi:hypothetical protein